MVNQNKLFSFKIKRQAKKIVFPNDVKRTVAYVFALVYRAESNPYKPNGLFRPFTLGESICYLRAVRCTNNDKINRAHLLITYVRTKELQQKKSVENDDYTGRPMKRKYLGNPAITNTALPRHQKKKQRG